MAQAKCTKCGKGYTEGNNNWYNCPDCEEFLCPDCVDSIMKGGQKQEKKRRQQLENTDNLDDFKQLSCPRCGTEMTMF